MLRVKTTNVFMGLWVTPRPHFLVQLVYVSNNYNSLANKDFVYNLLTDSTKMLTILTPSLIVDRYLIVNTLRSHVHMCPYVPL